MSLCLLKLLLCCPETCFQGTANTSKTSALHNEVQACASPTSSFTTPQPSVKSDTLLKISDISGCSQLGFGPTSDDSTFTSCYLQLLLTRSLFSVWAFFEQPPFAAPGLSSLTKTKTHHWLFQAGPQTMRVTVSLLLPRFEASQFRMTPLPTKFRLTCDTPFCNSPIFKSF